MKLIACGINHKTTPLELREKAYFSPEKAPNFLQQLIQKGHAREAVLLSTCNRTEIYCIATDHHPILEELSLQSTFELPLIAAHSYAHYNDQAISHVTRVASGLDSMIVGEPQILGQVKQAVQLAQTHGACQQELKRVFQHVFGAVKTIRTTTSVGHKPISLAYAIKFLAKRIFADLKCLKILCLGFGETIQPIAKHFHKQVANLWICNRTPSKAKLLTETMNVQVIDFAQMNHYLSQADIVICATSSPIPILGKGSIESALKIRKHRPMLLIDLAVPRDIEAEVEALDDVYFYTLDHLKTLIANNFSDRLQIAEQAEKIVDIQTARFIRHLKSLEAVSLIKSFRSEIDELYQQELAWSLNKLRAGAAPEDILTMMGKRLVNKFTHKPTVKLRQSSMQGKTDLFKPMQQLFNLEEE